MQLRPYQLEAVNATWQWLAAKRSNPVIVLPTGAGKSIVIADLCRRMVERKLRAICLAHRKELLEQNASELQSLVPGLPVAVYSAGLKRREVEHDVVCAGIQSVWSKAHEFGQRHLVIVDEAHLVGQNDNSMYRRFLDDLAKLNKGIRLCGLTATPFRTGTGDLCGEGEIFGGISYEAKIPALIADGCLSPITSRIATEERDTSKLAIRGGEFVASSMASLFSPTEVVAKAVAEMVERCAGRKSVMVFCSSVDHTIDVAERIEKATGERAMAITGETPMLERVAAIEAFKRQKLRWLTNCDVLTTGFNARCVDAVVVLRATCSAGLFAQMCGRGFRLSPETGKENCLILDYGENLKRHGTLDDPDFGRRDKSRSSGGGDEDDKIWKCDNCGCVNQIKLVACEECGDPKPVVERDSIRHKSTADTDAPILAAANEPPQTFEVLSVRYSKHVKKKDNTVSLRVDYEVRDDSMPLIDDATIFVTEYVGVGEDGFREGYYGDKAAKWWVKRCVDGRRIASEGIDYALAVANAGGLADVRAIKAAREGRFWRISNYMLGPAPSFNEWVNRLEEQTNGGGGSLEYADDFSSGGDLPF